MNFGRCARFAAIAAAAAVVLAACSGSSDSHKHNTAMPTVTSPLPTTSSGSPSPIDSTSSAPTSPSPTIPTTGPNVRPGEKPPVLAPVGHKNTAAGAVTFATYWMQTLDWGYATTSSALARTVYSSLCSDCRRFMKNFDLTANAGDHFIGGRLGVRSATIATNDKRNDAKYAVDVSVAVGALKTVDDNGKTVSTAAAITSATFRVWLSRSYPRFEVVDFKRVVSN